MFFLSACAQVPKESVELSVTVGRDLAEVHRAHRELAIEYFDCVKKDINEFIDEVYRPYMIQKTMADFRLLQRIQRAVERGDETRAFNIMKLFVSLLSEQIENYRKELLQNISKQESEVLLAIDDSYQKIQMPMLLSQVIWRQFGRSMIPRPSYSAAQSWKDYGKRLRAGPGNFLIRSQR